MLAIETVAPTDDSRMFSPISTAPSNSVKVPRTLLTMRWRTLKPTTEWLGSMVQVPAVRPGVEMVLTALDVLICFSRLVEVSTSTEREHGCAFNYSRAGREPMESGPRPKL